MVKINKLLFAFYCNIHTWLSNNAHKHEKIKRREKKKEKKAEAKECCSAIYQDRSIEGLISQQKKKKKAVNVLSPYYNSSFV